MQTHLARVPANRVSDSLHAFLDGKIGVWSAHVGADPVSGDYLGDRLSISDQPIVPYLPDLVRCRRKTA